MAAILPDILLFKGLHGLLVRKLGYRQRIAITQFRWRHVRPVHSTGQEIVLIISNYAEKLIVGIKNLTLHVPDDDADDVGIDEVTNFCLTPFNLSLHACNGPQIRLQHVTPLQQQSEIEIAVFVTFPIENTNRSKYLAIGPT